jgi:hypothetical protein
VSEFRPIGPLFHQALKRFLATQEGTTTKKQLQRALDRFFASYNEVRPSHGESVVGAPPCGLQRSGEGGAERPDHQGRRPAPPARQGGQDRLGHDPPPGPSAPHRHRRRLQGMAHRHAGRRARHRDRGSRRVAVAAPHPRSDRRLPADALRAATGSTMTLLWSVKSHAGRFRAPGRAPVRRSASDSA